MGVNLGSAWGSIEISTESAERSLSSLSKTLGSVGKGLSLAVTAPLVGLGVTALKSAADFEQSLNVMQQVTGATAAQMAGLQQQALDLGASTSFSAGEVAQAMLELGKAGLTAEQTGQAISGVLDLAAAGNLDLAQAAEIAANAVNAFGLEASDTNSVANLLAAAANASSVEVTDLAQGMQMASAVFASTGQEIGTLNTALALLGNNGLKGSDAGTSLKTMMMRLTAPTKEAAQLMRELGVSVYDAQGNMRALPDILQDFNAALTGTRTVTVTTSNRTKEQTERMEYLAGVIDRTNRKLADYASGLAGVAQSEEDKVVSVDRLNRELRAAQAEYAALAGIADTTTSSTVQMTEAQRNQALATIFGSDAIRAINILLAEGEQGWGAMAQALGNETAAADVANARMKGLSGAIEYFKGAVESLLIGAALPFTETLGDMIRKVADLLSGIGQLTPEQQRLAAILGVVAAAAGPVLMALSAITAAVGALVSPVGLVVAAVAGLGVAWATNFLGIRDKTLAVWNTVKPTLSQWAGWLQGQLPGAMASLQTAMTSGWASVQAHTAGAVAAIKEAWGQLLALLAPAIERVQAAFGAFQDKMAALAPKLGEFSDAIGNLWQAVQPILSALGQLIAVVFGVTSVALVNAFAAALTAAADVIKIALDGAVNSINYIAATLTNTVQLIQAIIRGDWDAAWGEAEQIVTDTGQYFADTWNNLKALAETIFTAIKDTVINTLEDLGVDATALLDSLKSTWETTWGALKSSVQPVIDIIGDVKDAVSDFVNWIKEIHIPNPFEGLGRAISGVGDTVKGIIPGFAKGTSYAPGGLANVGERGDEAVLLPRGAKVLTAPQTRAALAGAGGLVITVNIPVQVVEHGLDMYTLAYTVADVIRRRLR